MSSEGCSGCQVRERALCSTLSDGELARLNAISRQKHIERGATLMWAGDEGVVCGNVIAGMLKMTAFAADGREQIVGLLYPGDFVGRPQAGELPFSIAALTDSHLCIFPRAPFQAMLDDHIAMERMLLRRTMTALDEARHRMLLLGRGTAEEKLAGFLLEMIERSGAVPGGRAITAGEATIDLPLSRGQIADVLGLTIETVSRQMTHLRTAGIIDVPGGRLVEVRDLAALRARAMVD